jgi:hypothetical protein
MKSLYSREVTYIFVVVWQWTGTGTGSMPYHPHCFLKYGGEFHSGSHELIEKVASVVKFAFDIILPLWLWCLDLSMVMFRNEEAKTTRVIDELSDLICFK